MSETFKGKLSNALFLGLGASWWGLFYLKLAHHTHPL